MSEQERAIGGPAGCEKCGCEIFPDNRCQCEPNTPASDQPEKCVHCEEPETKHKKHLGLIGEKGACPVYRSGTLTDWHPTNRFTPRPIAAEKREEEQYQVRQSNMFNLWFVLDGERRFAECWNEADARNIADAMNSAAQISTLQQQPAEAHKDTRTCGELSCDECNERYQKAIVEISTLQKQLAQEKEARETLAFKWDAETCSHCGYMRSPVAPCKCGQLVVRGANDHLRKDRDNLREALRPFAEIGDAYAQLNADPETRIHIVVSVGELRAANAAIQQSEGN